MAIGASFTFSFSSITPANSSNLCERHIIAAARQFDVPVGILYSVGLTETGRKNSLHPFALNIEGRAVYPRDRQQAIKTFLNARRGGASLIDIGCMQINHYWHRKRFSSLEAMFQPSQNVKYAARFLKELRARHGNWTMALARYHAGPNNDPAQKRYVCTVIANLVATGFGAWTRNAKSFCR